jgi:hypothetical protein
MSADVRDEIELLLRARTALLTIESVEEQRVRDLVRQAAITVGLPYHRWTLGQGLVVNGANAMYDTKQPEPMLRALADWQGDGVFHLEDLEPFLDTPAIRRGLKDALHARGTARRTVVVSGATLKLPADLAALGARVRWHLPSDLDLERVIARVVHDLSRSMQVAVLLQPDEMKDLIVQLRGLTVHEAERAVARAVADDLALTTNDLPGIVAIKREMLEEGGALELVGLDRKAPPPAAGLGRLRAWLDMRRRAFTREAEQFGLKPPRGMLLLGVQGCGKSLAARLTACLFDLPLVRLETGRLYDKYIGESEKRLDAALKAVERMSPCVLWIDEIEKALASGGDGHADGGLGARLTGRLLTWLQEREGAVFVVATCNDARRLPPELMRKGRFDEVFFVDLPTPEERVAILAVHLEARQRDPAAFDCLPLAMAADGFSGAELEQAVVGGLHRAFAEGVDLASRHLADEIAATRPLAVLRREEVQALRDWAAERTVPAGGAPA